MVGSPDHAASPAGRLWKPRQVGPGRVAAESDELLAAAEHLDLARMVLRVTGAGDRALCRLAVGGTSTDDGRWCT
jgi:hypothetical protein